MYNNLARYYDYVFPAGKAQLKFFHDEFNKHNVTRILDLACGSGNYSIEFAKWGLEVTGVDYERSMIELAKEKILNYPELNINFMVGDMREISLSQPFDAVVCIGNSLVHLLTDEDLTIAMSEMSRLCKPGGLLVIQILNYDYVIEKKVTILPDIHNDKENLVFTRQYEHQDNGLISFNTSLILNKNNEQHSLDVGSVLLRPLRPSELENLLISAGFSDLEFYGGFNGKPAGLESMALVVKAFKK